MVFSLLMFELCVSLFSLLGFILLFKMAFEIPLAANKMFWSSPGSFPAVLCAILVILSICWVIDTVLEIRKMKIKEGHIEKISFAQLFGTKEEQQRLLKIAVYTLVYIFILIPVLGRINRQFGYTIATFLFLLFSIKEFGGINWKRTVAISAPITLTVYLIFAYVLRLPMPR